MIVFKIAVTLLLSAHFSIANDSEELPTHQLIFYKNHTKDAQQIVKSVREFGGPDDISCLSVYGPHAFPVVVAPHKFKNEIYLYPLIAAGTYGQGRIIGFASKDMVLAKWRNEHNDSSYRQLVWGAIIWARQSVGSSIRNKEIGFFGACCKELKTFLKDKKLQYSEIDLGKLRNYTQLSRFDVLINVQDKNYKHVDILLEYANRGGIVLLGQSTRNLNFESHVGFTFAANMISSHAGFVWTSSKGAAVKGAIKTNISKLENTHFSQAWNLISKLPKPLNATHKQALRTVETALAWVPPTDPFWVNTFNFTNTIHNLLTTALFP